MKRTVGFSILDDGTVEQRLPLFGGVKGEHNATCLSIMMGTNGIYQSGDIVRLEFLGGDGTLLSSDIVEDIITDGVRISIRYSIPKMLTMLGGQLCIRLVISAFDEYGNETVTFRSGEMVLWFEEAPVENGTPFWTGVSEMLSRTVTAKEAAVTAASHADEAKAAAITAQQAATDAVTNALLYSSASSASAEQAKQAAADADAAATEAVAAYVEQHPMQPGATPEQAKKIDDTAALLAAHITDAIKMLRTKMNNSGHEANKYLGTDESGNVVVKDMLSLKGDPGEDGKDGVDGKTPVKGVDYFTEADKAELVTAVLAAIPDGNGVSY